MVLHRAVQILLFSGPTPAHLAPPYCLSSLLWGHPSRQAPESLLCVSINTQSCGSALPPPSLDWLTGCDWQSQSGVQVPGEPIFLWTSLD
ncbi:hypothetical protein AB205_0206540 [Aquarana catesbeiana]|uniref:Uncharacterized protein n=1 Tax=Aquarana catesbeiana TaxID=8400 RepID=A0A2G9QJ10_AQUCT|nr:hypothetical protein AB205_0206540 [Aquarana catesbeiana]